MSPEPQHRRLVRTDTPGIYHPGRRYVAISYHRGRRI
jgi:hypothetical protein